MDLEFHPLANCLSLIEGAEFDELVADIKERGLALPIELYDGKILDGRNRYAACKLADYEPLFETYTRDDPAGYALAVNITRRNLTKGQQAMTMAMIYPDPPDASERGKKGGRGNKAPHESWGAFSAERLRLARSQIDKR